MFTSGFYSPPDSPGNYLDCLHLRIKKKRAINNLKAVQEDLVSQGVGGDEFQGFTFFYSSL